MDCREHNTWGVLCAERSPCRLQAVASLWANATHYLKSIWAKSSRTVAISVSAPIEQGDFPALLPSRKCLSDKSDTEYGYHRHARAHANAIYVGKCHHCHQLEKGKARRTVFSLSSSA